MNNMKWKISIRQNSIHTFINLHGRCCSVWHVFWKTSIIQFYKLKVGKDIYNVIIKQTNFLLKFFLIFPTNIIKISNICSSFWSLFCKKTRWMIPIWYLSIMNRTLKIKRYDLIFFKYNNFLKTLFKMYINSIVLWKVILISFYNFIMKYKKIFIKTNLFS